jgi:hypothetical protein
MAHGQELQRYLLKMSIILSAFMFFSPPGDPSSSDTDALHAYDANWRFSHRKNIDKVRVRIPVLTANNIIHFEKRQKFLYYATFLRLSFTSRCF